MHLASKADNEMRLGRFITSLLAHGLKAIDDDIIESAKLLLKSGKTKREEAKLLGIGEATLYRRLAN